MLDDWNKRKTPALQADSIASALTGIGMSQPEGIAYSFSMPPIMGLSMTGGFEGYIQNKAGHTSTELMDKTNELLNAAAKNPALTNVRTTFSVSTPQYNIELDREKPKR